MGADGVRAKDGQPLHIELWTQSDSSFRRLTEVVQAQLKAVGIDATITTFDSSTIRDEYKKDVHQAAVRSYFWDNADIIDWFADEGLRVYGRIVPSRFNLAARQMVLKDPVGPVAASKP